MLHLRMRPRRAGVYPGMAAKRYPRHQPELVRQLPAVCQLQQHNTGGQRRLPGAVVQPGAVEELPATSVPEHRLCRL